MQNFLTSIGHILGFISVGLFFYSYQCTEKRKLMVIQTVATALSCVQYTVNKMYQKNNIVEGRDIQLYVASQHTVGETID